MKISFTELVFDFATSKALAKKTDTSTDEEEGVRITELDSPYAGIWRGENEDKVLFDDICVFASGEKYRVTAKGSGIGDKFIVTNKKSKIAYQVYWNNEAFINSNMFQLTENVASRIFTTTETTSSTCNGGENLTARLKIVFLKEDLMKSAPGSYFGTLILTIEPI